MKNVTARLALKIQNRPQEINWSDSRPQRSRSALTINDLVPNNSDGEELHQRAVAYVMRFLVAKFRSLSTLKQFVPSLRSPHPVSKSEVVPMKILPFDKKYTQENIHILERFQSDAGLSSDPQVTEVKDSTIHSDGH